MIISKKALNQLKRELPDNWASILAKKFPIGDTMIRAILRGDYADNHGVIEAAIQLRDKEKARKAALKKSLEKKIYA